jgi:chromosome segregation ATPase
MKSLINWLLSALGLVTAGRYKAAAEQERQARAAAHEWKAKAAASMARAKDLEDEVKRQTRHADKSQASLAKLTARHEKMDDLRRRLADAERELLVAREHLMAVEVKLDILEGAANVLDIRTRAVISKQP